MTQKTRHCGSALSIGPKPGPAAERHRALANVLLRAQACRCNGTGWCHRSQPAAPAIENDA